MFRKRKRKEKKGGKPTPTALATEIKRIKEELKKPGIGEGTKNNLYALLEILEGKK